MPTILLLLSCGSPPVPAPAPAPAPAPSPAPAPPEPAPVRTVVVDGFEDADSVDRERTTAIYDPDAGAWRAIQALPQVDDTASGSLVAQGSLAPGSYWLSSFESLGDVTVAGDLSLYVRGPVSVRSGTFFVSGELVVLVDGPLTIDRARVLVTDDVTIVQTSDDGVVVRGIAPEGVGTTIHEGTLSGAITVVTLGDLVLERVGASGPAIASGQSGLYGGRVTLRSQGDLVLDGDVFPGDGDFRGNVTLLADGTIQVPGRVTDAAALELTATGGVAISGLVEAHSVKLRTEGTLDVSGTVEAGGGAWATLSAGRIEIRDGATVDARDVVVESATELAIGVTTDGSLLRTEVAGAEGSTLTLRAGERLSVGDRTVVRGGDGCSEPGSLAIEAGVVEAHAQSTVRAGVCADEPSLVGGLTVVEGPVDVQIDTELRGEALVTSRPLALPGEGARLVDVALTVEGEAQIEIAIDGEDFRPVADVLGATLAEGWRYRVRLPRRGLDGAILDAVAITLELG